MRLKTSNFGQQLQRTKDLNQNSEIRLVSVQPFSTTLPKIATFWGQLWPVSDNKNWSLFVEVSSSLKYVIDNFNLILISNFQTYKITAIGELQIIANVPEKLLYALFKIVLVEK